MRAAGCTRAWSPAVPKAQDDDLVMSLVELALSQPPDARETYVRDVAACVAAVRGAGGQRPATEVTYA